MKFESFAKENEYDDFIRNLPNKLKTDLAYLIYKKQLANISYFKHKPKKFIAWMAPLFIPMKILKDGYIFEEGDIADQIYFLTKGSASLIFSEGVQEFSFYTYEQGD